MIVNSVLCRSMTNLRGRRIDFRYCSFQHWSYPSPKMLNITNWWSIYIYSTSYLKIKKTGVFLEKTYGRFVDCMRPISDFDQGRNYANLLLRFQFPLACIFCSFFGCRHHTISSNIHIFSILSIELKEFRWEIWNNFSGNTYDNQLYYIFSFLRISLNKDLNLLFHLEHLNIPLFGS